MTTIDEIRDLIVTGLGWPGDRRALTADYPLIDNDVVDSLGIFEIVAFLESRYGVEVDDEDLVPENFETIAAIARLIDG
ncbi:MAG: acyl carrier protein [Acidimicrobiales bacterium]